MRGTKNHWRLNFATKNEFVCKKNFVQPQRGAVGETPVTLHFTPIFKTEVQKSK